jgi:DNA topoisomerase-1
LPIYVLTGRFGPYVQLGEVTPDNPKPKRASLPKGLKPEQVTVDVATQLLSLPRLLGSHPETGKPIQAGLGRFGPYVVCDGDFRSLTGSDDLFSITLERALELLSQPKTRGRQAAKPIKDLGSHPVDQAPIQIFSGRYGPYVKHGDLNATIPKDRDPETLTLEEALALLAAQAEKAPKTTKKKTAKTQEKAPAETSTPARKASAKAATKASPPTSKAATSTKTAKTTRQAKADPDSPLITPEMPTPSRITIKNRGKTS